MCKRRSIDLKKARSQVGKGKLVQRVENDYPEACNVLRAFRLSFNFTFPHVMRQRFEAQLS